MSIIETYNILVKLYISVFPSKTGRPANKLIIFKFTLPFPAERQKDGRTDNLVYNVACN